MLEYIRYWFMVLFGMRKTKITSKEEVKVPVEVEPVVPVKEEVIPVVDTPVVEEVVKTEEPVQPEPELPVEPTLPEEELTPPCKVPVKYGKLTCEQVREIRAIPCIKDYKEVSAKYNVSQDTIRRVIKGTTYKKC